VLAAVFDQHAGVRTVVATADPDLRLALQVALRAEPGFAVAAAVSDAGCLLAVLEAARPDLVLLDSNLAITAADVLAHARAHSPGHPPKIALLAGNEEQATATADVVVRKGGLPSVLLHALRRLRARP